MGARGDERVARFVRRRRHRLADIEARQKQVALRQPHVALQRRHHPVDALGAGADLREIVEAGAVEAGVIGVEQEARVEVDLPQGRAQIVRDRVAEIVHFRAELVQILDTCAQVFRLAHRVGHVLAEQHRAADGPVRAAPGRLRQPLPDRAAASHRFLDARRGHAAIHGQAKPFENARPRQGRLRFHARPRQRGIAVFLLPALGGHDDPAIRIKHGDGRGRVADEQRHHLRLLGDARLL